MRERVGVEPIIRHWRIQQTCVEGCAIKERIGLYRKAVYPNSCSMGWVCAGAFHPPPLDRWVPDQMEHTPIRAHQGRPHMHMCRVSPQADNIQDNKVCVCSEGYSHAEEGHVAAFMRMVCTSTSMLSPMLRGTGGSISNPILLTHPSHSQAHLCK